MQQIDFNKIIVEVSDRENTHFSVSVLKTDGCCTMGGPLL